GQVDPGRSGSPDPDPTPGESTPGTLAGSTRLSPQASPGGEYQTGAAARDRAGLSPGGIGLPNARGERAGGGSLPPSREAPAATDHRVPPRACLLPGTGPEPQPSGQPAPASRGRAGVAGGPGTPAAAGRRVSQRSRLPVGTGPKLQPAGHASEEDRSV